MDSLDMVGNAYLIRPNYQHKFKPVVVKECIREILKEKLSELQYDPEEVPGLSLSLAESIKNKLKGLDVIILSCNTCTKLYSKDMGFDRYKLVVQVVIGEQRGEGVKMASRCFWDADTDSFAEDVFMNDSLFCVAAAFGCYYY